MAEKNLSPLQVRLLEMMKWFHQFCVEHDLRYFCLGGTMLGAQRHHGFIPWDDDIDVGLPRRDYEKLMELMKDDNYDPFVLETPYSRNADYCYPYSKLYDTRTTLIENRRKDVVRGIFIDVFPLDGLGETEQESIHNYKRINKKYNMLLTTVCGIRGERSWYKNLAVLAVRCIPSYFLSYKRLMMELDRLCALVDYDSSTWVCNCLGAWRFREAMERKYFCIHGKNLNNRLENAHLFPSARNSCKQSAKGHILREVPSTVRLLWQSTVLHSLHCGYHILPGARVSLLLGVLVAACHYSEATRFS